MEERDFLHEICLTALSASKAVKFAAVVDNNAKLIVSQYRKKIQTTSRPNYRIGDCCLLSYLFYLDHLMPIITKMIYQEYIPMLHLIYHMYMR